MSWGLIAYYSLAWYHKATHSTICIKIKISILYEREAVKMFGISNKSWIIMNKDLTCQRYGYSSESTHGELSNECQHDRVLMVFKNLCILVLWTKVASSLEGLSLSCCPPFTHFHSLHLAFFRRFPKRIYVTMPELLTRKSMLGKLLEKHNSPLSPQELQRLAMWVNRSHFSPPTMGDWYGIFKCEY